MEKAVSAADANRNFSQLLQSVRRGQSVVVTSHGKPVARISPVDQPDKMQSAARNVLLDRLKQQKVSKPASWTRDELYEEQT